jgi:hypothetical protein
MGIAPCFNRAERRGWQRLKYSFNGHAETQQLVVGRHLRRLRPAAASWVTSWILDLDEIFMGSNGNSIVPAIATHCSVGTATMRPSVFRQLPDPS